MPIKTSEEEQNKNPEKSTQPNWNPCPIPCPFWYQLTRPTPRGTISRSSPTNRALTNTNHPISPPMAWLGPSRLKRNECKVKRKGLWWLGLWDRRCKERSMVAGLVRSVMEKRVCGGWACENRDGEKAQWMKKEEMERHWGEKHGEWNAERIKNKKVMWMQNKKLIFFLGDKTYFRPYIFTRFSLWSLTFFFTAFSPCLEKRLLF